MPILEGVPALAAALLLFVVCRRYFNRRDAGGPDTAYALVSFLALVVATLGAFGVLWTLDPLFAEWSAFTALTTGILVGAMLVVAAACAGPARGPERPARRPQLPEGDPPGPSRPPHPSHPAAGRGEGAAIRRRAA